MIVMLMEFGRKNFGGAESAGQKGMLGSEPKGPDLSWELMGGLESDLALSMRFYLSVGRVSGVHSRQRKEEIMA